MTDTPEIETLDFPPGDENNSESTFVPDHTASAESNPVVDFFKKPRAKKEKNSDSKPPTMPRPGVIARQLAEVYTGLGMMLMPFDPTCGSAIMQASEECGKSVEKLCKQNPTVRRYVLKFLETSVIGELIIAHMPILLAVAMHHVGPVKKGMEAMGQNFQGFNIPTEDESVA